MDDETSELAAEVATRRAESLGVPVAIVAIGDQPLSVYDLGVFGDWEEVATLPRPDDGGGGP